MTASRRSTSPIPMWPAGPPVVRSGIQDRFLLAYGTTEGVNSPAAGIPVNNFSARWSAELHVAFSGEYRFIINVRDSDRLWLDDKLLIERWPNDACTRSTARTGVSLTGRQRLLPRLWSGTSLTPPRARRRRLEWVDPFDERSIVGRLPATASLKANRPRPTLGQMDVTPTPILRWSPATRWSNTNVYFGTDARRWPPPARRPRELYQGRQALDATTFDPAPWSGARPTIGGY